MRASLWLLMTAASFVALVWLSLVVVSGFTIWTEDSNLAGLGLQGALLSFPVILLFALRRSKESFAATATVFGVAWGLALGSALLLFSTYDPIDPLASVENGYGSAVYTHALATSSGDQIICVSANSRRSCTRANADVIVSGALRTDDVSVVWADYENDVLIVSAASGTLEKSPRAALDGNVTIEYR